MNWLRLAVAFTVLNTATVLAQAQAPGMEFWAGGGVGAGRRNASVAGSVGTGTGTGAHLEAGVRYRFVSLRVRHLSTTFAADSGSQAVGGLASSAALLSLGPQAIGVDVGYGQRVFEGTIATRSWRFLTVGGRGDIALGTSGLTAGASFQLYVSPKESGGTTEGTGRSAETHLVFRPRSTPIYILLSYRVEAFTVEGTPAYPDETTTIILGGGLHFGRRRPAQ